MYSSVKWHCDDEDASVLVQDEWKVEGYFSSVD